MLVGNLCEKVPQAVECLGARIIEYVRRGDRPENVIEGLADRSIAQSRKDKAEDRSYRPPKYAEATNTRSMLESGEKRQSACLAGGKRQSACLAGGKLAKVSNTVDSNASQDFTKLPSKSTKEAKCDSNVADSAARTDPVDNNAPQDSTKAPSTSTKRVKCDDSKVDDTRWTLPK